MFSKLIDTTTLEEMYELFNVSASLYWSDHFTFGKSSVKKTKKLTKKFIDLLIINTILPLKFCYARHMGNDVNEEIIQIITQIQKEENAVVLGFKNQGVEMLNAKDSQAIIQLYNTYCRSNRCLECAVGSSLLHRID